MIIYIYQLESKQGKKDVTILLLHFNKNHIWY